MKLYEITAVVRALLDTLSDRPLVEDGLAIECDTDHAQAQEAFEGAMAKFEDKIRSVLAYALELDADINARTVAIERMQKANERDQRKAVWLRDYAQNALEGAKVPLPLRYTEFTVNLVKVPRSAEILDPAAVPAEYKTTIYHDPEVKIDKAAVNKDARMGLVIPGTRLLPQTYRMTLK